MITYTPSTTDHSSAEISGKTDSTLSITLEPGNFIMDIKNYVGVYALLDMLTYSILTTREHVELQSIFLTTIKGSLVSYSTVLPFYCIIVILCLLYCVALH